MRAGTPGGQQAGDGWHSLMDELVRVVVRVGLERAEAGAGDDARPASRGVRGGRASGGLELVRTRTHRARPHPSGVSRGNRSAVRIRLAGRMARPSTARSSWVACGSAHRGSRSPSICPGGDRPRTCFGTGAHPTTQLCVDLLSGLERGSLLDVGCGSGVLAIAAARLGFAPVTAIDVDPVAVEVTVANAVVNGVALDVRVADALHGAMPSVDVAAGERAARACRGDPRAARRRVGGHLRVSRRRAPCSSGLGPCGLGGARRLGGRPSFGASTV